MTVSPVLKKILDAAADGEGSPAEVAEFLLTLNAELQGLRRRLESVQARPEYAIAMLRRIQLREGDVVHVEAGDPATGWIPLPEVANEIAKVFKAAIDGLGFQNVAVVVTAYPFKVSDILTREDAAGLENVLAKVGPGPGPGPGPGQGSEPS